jgi:hypothetical protein
VLLVPQFQTKTSNTMDKRFNAVLKKWFVATPFYFLLHNKTMFFLFFRAFSIKLMVFINRTIKFYLILRSCLYGRLFQSKDGLFWVLLQRKET